MERHRNSLCCVENIRLQLEKADIWGDVRDSEQNESLNITFGKKIPRRFAFVYFVRICVL